MKTTRSIISAAAALLLASMPAALSHPHVFAEANLEVALTGDGTVEALRHVWRFDDLFSSTVLLEFDKNSDLTLDDDELEEVGKVIHESLAEFDYFQFVENAGKAVKMTPPEAILANYQDNQLIVFFESKPVEKLALQGTLSFGVYDPTFYTAIDFSEDDNMSVAPLPASCKKTVVRPDPDEAIAMNQDKLTEAFFEDPSSNDMSKLFATRLELTCS